MDSCQSAQGGPKEIFMGEVPRLKNTHVPGISNNSRNMEQSRAQGPEQEPTVSLLSDSTRVVLSYLHSYIVP